MSRLKVLSLLAIGLLLTVHSMFASTVAVGTCKPSLVSFATISAAVGAVPSGSTVEVCPGTYPEQVTIAQPLTLKGISSGNAGQAVITVPGSGLVEVTSGSGTLIAPLVHVTAGPVNISDITVDGTGNNVTDTPWLVGILYDDGSSGIVNEITARNLCCAGGATGVWAENNSSPLSVTIENSSFHDINDSAVITEGSGGALLATVKGNTVLGGFAQFQLLSDSSSLTANVGNGGSFIGIYSQGSSTGSNTVSGNAVNAPIGLYMGGGVTATSNKITNATTAGINDLGGGATYKSNTITKAGVGIEFNCNATIPTVTGNTINDATTGLDNVPSSFSGSNNFDNVGTLRTDGCGFKPTPHAPSGPMRAPAHQ
jgi:hypothetical protein